jgi:hypothetical protein
MHCDVVSHTHPSWPNLPSTPLINIPPLPPALSLTLPIHSPCSEPEKEEREKGEEKEEEEEKEGEEKGALLLEHHRRSMLAATSTSPELEEKPFLEPLLQAQAMEEPHLD